MSTTPTTTKQWKLTSNPKGLPTIKDNFKLEDAQIPELKDGQVLLKSLYFSNDPAQRGWMDHYEDESRLYVPPIHVGEVVRAGMIAEVVQSKSADLKEGDQVQAFGGWTQYSVQDAKGLNVLKPLPGGLPVTHYLGALGLTGLTAYYGVKEIMRAGPDDVVIVSGAAGAAGSMAVQIAKNIIGCKRVIGIAGGEKKCKWVKELGADECLDYKASTFAEDLIKATPDFCNAYFDNVGGEILDLILSRMARNGRIAACGAISDYNAGDAKSGIKNWFNVISMRLEIKGFIVMDYLHKVGEVQQILRKGLEEKKLHIADAEHVVPTKIEDVPTTWLTLFSGGNTGKLITKLL
ncbi:hypothetical protein HKX48_005594 [Thoreauomyces humboldtii]|nr:hypothetical protein HKX48_005594 [Thoreauomyces humboldtii]